MPYTLGTKQLALLNIALQEAEGSSQPYGKYARAYELVFSMISQDTSSNIYISESDLTSVTDLNAFYEGWLVNGLDGVDTSDWTKADTAIEGGAWVFLRGVCQVNWGSENPSGEGDYSKFIREYSRVQYLNRFGFDDLEGANPSEKLDFLEGKIQETSDEIARLVLNDILTNHQVPSIDQIAVNDASAAATKLFGTNEIGGWAGNPFLIPVGHTLSYQANILHNIALGGDSHIGNTYDALSVIKSIYTTMSNLGWTVSIDVIWDVLSSVVPDANNSAMVGIVNFLATSFDTLNITDQFLEDAYGANFHLADLALSTSEIILGTSRNDTGILGTDDDDLINAGKGNDTIIVSRGDDIIDGGEGINLIDYSSMDGSITVNIKDSSQVLTTNYIGSVLKEFNGLFNDGLDNLHNIESIKGTNEQDTFLVHGMKNDISLNGNEGLDTLSLFYLSTAASFYVDDGNVSTNEKTIYFSNIERFEGTSNNDLFVLKNIGNRTLIGGDAITADRADYSAVQGDITIIGTGSGYTVTSGANTDILVSIEEIVGGGSTNNFYVSSDQERVILRGGVGNDNVVINVSGDKRYGHNIWGDGGLNTVEVNGAHADSWYFSGEYSALMWLDYSEITMYEKGSIIMPNFQNVIIDGKFFRADLLREAFIGDVAVGAASAADLNADGRTTLAEMYHAAYYKNGTGGSGIGAGINVFTDGSGNVTSVQSASDMGGKWLDYKYGDDVLSPLLITDASYSGGATEMTLETYLKEINFLSGIQSSDLRFTVSDDTNATLTVWIDKLNYSFTVENFELGKTITSIGEYNTSVHSQVQSSAAGTVTSSVKGTFEGNYNGAISYTSNLATETYYFEKFNFKVGSSLNMTGTISLKGTNSNDVLYGMDSRDDMIYGYDGNDAISAKGGNDTLDGGTGADLMLGGAGNDIYIVDNIGDLIVENLGEGTDTIRSSIDYALAANVENLILTGTQAVTALGNELNNSLTGNSANNYLDGGAGIDTMAGGSGDDTYIVDNTNDIIIENSSEGTDTVYSSTNYTLSANIENIVLTGTGNNAAIGNALDNIIVGNSGTNLLNGGAGADYMMGGAGNDYYIVDNIGDAVIELANEGTDVVQSSLATYYLVDNVENLLLLAGALNGAGNSLNNTITGNTADNILMGMDGNDMLDGQAGADYMYGGTGNDTYMVENIGDVVVEYANEGVDTVRTILNNYALGDHVENLVLLGAALNGSGNNLDNTITGTSGNNILMGMNGNDIIDGGLGNDTMYGGMGDDTYYVNASGDSVIEYGGEGVDTVLSTVTYTLSDFVENLTLTGTSSINATGNWWDNVLTGNNANNTLTGGNGADTLIGNAGNDTLYGDDGNDFLNGGENSDVLYGGAGSDTFYLNSTNGIDTIKDFNLGQNDKIDISDLLIGYDPLTDALSDFVYIASTGPNSNLMVDMDGTGTVYGWTQVATIELSLGLPNEAALAASGNLIVS